MILSANANTPFWEHWAAETYPQWAALTGIAHVPVTPSFAIEPHYHDCDEFWLLIDGDGEAWMTFASPAGQTHGRGECAGRRSPQVAGTQA